MNNKALKIQNQIPKRNGKDLSEDMAEYARGIRKTSEIARAHGVTEGAITARAKKAGLPLRGQGRWKKEEPTERQKRIIRLARNTTGTHAAAVFSITKQRVSKLLKRWKDWMPETLGKGNISRRILRTSSADYEARKNPKERVISFRVDEWVFGILREQLQNPVFENLGSENQIAREMVLAFISGHLPVAIGVREMASMDTSKSTKHG